MKYMKRITALLCMMWLLLGAASAMAASSAERVFDNANLFSSSEAAGIRSAIADFQKSTGMDFVVLTSKTAHGDTSQQKIADDFYDKYGFGLDEENSGMLYYIDMYDRQEYISTTGKMIDYLTDERIERSLDVSNPNLRRAKYADAVNALIPRIEQFIKAGIPEGQYRYDIVTGQPLTARHKALTGTEMLVGGGIALVIGFIYIVSVQSRYRLKGSTYRYSYGPNSSMEMLETRDDYIRTSVARTRKAPPPSSGGGGFGGGGGSGVHTGGGGASHGGGGRGF